jgi:O-glycosyl hydrolase
MKTYDLLPMIKEAQEIKENQKDNELRIMSSAWTAPAWMKDIEEYGTLQEQRKIIIKVQVART